MCAGAADVAELLDTDAVTAAGTKRLVPPPAGISGRAAAGAAGMYPTKALTLTQKPILGGKPATAEWAVRGGVRDLDAEFERLRPNLAYQFPFELDRFQKEAVVHLEQAREPFCNEEQVEPWSLLSLCIAPSQTPHTLYAQGAMYELRRKHVQLWLQEDRRMLMLRFNMHFQGSLCSCYVTWQ